MPVHVAFLRPDLLHFDRINPSVLSISPFLAVRDSCISPAVPNRGRRTPGVRNAIVQGESLHVLRCTFVYKNNHDLWKLVSAIVKRILSSLIIPVNIPNLTI